MNNSISKKELFTNPQKSKKPIIIAGILVSVIVAISLFIFVGLGGKGSEKYFGSPVAEARSYVGKNISMTLVNPIIEDGNIKISLEEVDKNSIVSFEVENNEKQTIPMMAYITPSGRLFVGSSMCEPCRGTKFSLAGETLVCDTCKTTYTIESHEFLSGAKVCGSYPPVYMNPTVVNGNIIISKEEVSKWKIRAL